jgi:hypothetical protein
MGERGESPARACGLDPPGCDGSDATAESVPGGPIYVCLVGRGWRLLCRATQCALLCVRFCGQGVCVCVLECMIDGRSRSASALQANRVKRGPAACACTHMCCAVCGGLFWGNACASVAPLGVSCRPLWWCGCVGRLRRATCGHRGWLLCRSGQNPPDHHCVVVCFCVLFVLQRVPCRSPAIPALSGKLGVASKGFFGSQAV